MTLYTLEDVKNKVIILNKDLNTLYYKDFESKLNDYLEDNVKNIIISFKNVRYIPSKTINLLFNMEIILNKRGGGIIITDINEYVKWVFITSGHYENFKKTKNIDHALCLMRM